VNANGGKNISNPVNSPSTLSQECHGLVGLGKSMAHFTNLKGEDGNPHGFGMSRIRVGWHPLNNRLPASSIAPEAAP
jgi:hypothetical protein